MAADKDSEDDEDSAGNFAGDPQKADVKRANSFQKVISAKKTRSEVTGRGVMRIDTKFHFHESAHF